MGENRLESLKNCKKCNRLFTSSDPNTTVCTRCDDEFDNNFAKVREYIYDNPKSSVKDVSMGTSVAPNTILKWIRDGKIVLSQHSIISLCERCGEPVEGGRFCGICIKDITDGLRKGLEESLEESKTKKSPDHSSPRTGMHIKERK